MVDALHQWLVQQRRKVPDGSATARAIDYSLNRWQALTRFVDDGALPIDNNWVENQIRPIALGRNNWLFAGSLRVCHVLTRQQLYDAACRERRRLSSTSRM